MKEQKEYLVLVALLCLVGCSTPKKLQRVYRFSDTCRESYEFFSDWIVRKNGGLIEFVEPVNEVYEQLLSEHYINEGTCWSDVLPEKGVIKLFGVPHKRSEGKVSGEITLTYFIRTNQCMNLDGITRADEKCGNLIFFFSKGGKPKGSIFYALNAAKNDK